MDRIFSGREVPSLTVEDLEKWQEVALVDISYEVLNRANKTLTYREIFKEAAKMKGLTDEELMELLPQVYTEMNLDGRFICISAGQWGLKKWYTTESIEESVEALARSKGIDDDDDYGFDDEEEIEEDFIEDEDFDDPDDEDNDDEEDLDEDIIEDEEVIDEYEDEEDTDLEAAEDEDFPEEEEAEEDK